MNGYHSKQPRFWRGLSFAIGLTGALLWPSSVSAQDATRDLAQQGVSAKQRPDKQENAVREDGPENRSESRTEQPLSWARIDFLLNQVDLVPRRARARRARISDVLGIGDALRTFESSNAELRFNDGSEVRIGSRATFRFTPNTRNFELTNGTVLLLIPPERGRTTIQTPNAVTGIQGSALFVRYIEETDTTIVGALTDNPDGPMILYTNNGTEEQALYANQVGVVEGDRITELYEIDSRAFWESSGLAETFDYTEDVGSVVDDLDGVRQEIRDAIENQSPIDGSNVVENPDNFSRPQTAEQPQMASPANGSVEEPSEPTTESESEVSNAAGGEGTAVDNPSLILGGEGTEESEGRVIQYEGSPAEEFHNQNGRPAGSTNGGGTNALQPAPLTEAESDDEAASAGNGNRPSSNTGQSGTNTNPLNEKPSVNGGSRPLSDRPTSRPESNPPAAPTTPPTGGTLLDNPVLPGLPGSDNREIVVPPTVGSGRNPRPTPTAQPNVPTGGVAPLPSGALQDAKPTVGSDDEDETEAEENGNKPTGSTVDSAGGAVKPGVSGAGGSDGSGGSAEGSSGTPVIEETDATLNNPDEAEAVAPPTVTEEAAEDQAPIIEQPDAAPSNPGGAVNPAPVLEGESEEAAPIIEETDATLNNLDEAEAVEIPAPAETETVDELLEAPDEEVTELETPVIPPSRLVEPETLEDEAVVEVEAVEVVPEAPAVEAVEVVPSAPDVFEDETVETPVLETPTNALEELPPETIPGEGVPGNLPAEDAPLVELEDSIPAQLEETVPFAVEQVDELSAEQELLREGNRPVDNAGDSDGVEDATLSDTPSVQPGLR